MRAGRMLLVAFVLAAFTLELQSQAGQVIQIDFSNPGLTPSHWRLVIHPDGSGHFHSEMGKLPKEASQSSGSELLVAPDQDRDVHLGAQFTGHVFETARNHKWFNEECESHLKVAFQGSKELSYRGPEGQGSCKFNYAKNKEIQALGDSLVGVAGMILEGARLEILLQHDRLGLDREMEYVVEAQGDGRIQQICTIRGILERLAEDQAVMERVRKRARVLLAKTEE